MQKNAAGVQSLIEAMKNSNMDRAVIVTVVDPNHGYEAVVDSPSSI
jgi:hypothetical protein